MPINKESLQRRLEKALGRYDAKPVNDEDEIIPLADEAVAFRFVFSKDGEDYGTVYVTIDDTNSLTVWFDDEIMDSPSTPSPGLDFDDTWTGFLTFIKKWAMNNQLSFKTDNKNHLGNEMARRKRMQEKEKISEGYHAMGKKASYNDAVPNVKIILQHSKMMQEGEQRFRHIEKIFVENQNGERFLVPTTKPGLARVFARHIAEGGTPYDERANHIQSLVEEYNKMAGFVRATRNGQFNESAQQLVQEGINHYVSLRESLSKMTGHRGYTAYFESWTPSLMEDETDASAINELFVQETLDPRIESVMPILSRLHKQVAEMKEVTELDEWAESLLSEKMVMGADTDASSGGTVHANIEEDEGIQSQNPQGIPESELDDIEEGKTGPGLWANIHAKRERIKHGSGEKMRKPGSKGAPTAQNFRDAAKEDVEIDEGILDTVKKVGGKVLDKLGHGSDEDLLKDLKKKAGVRNPETGKPSMAHSDVEKVDEDGQFAGDYKTGPAGQWRNKGPKANKPAKVGDLVGANESVQSTMKMLDNLLSENFINSTAQAVTTEGHDPYEDNPVVNAITRRILMQRHDLLAKYGPEKVRDAIESEADFVGDVEEIGSSDVSAWVKAVERTLAEGEKARDAFKGMFGGDADELTKGLSIREDEGYWDQEDEDHGLFVTIGNEEDGMFVGMIYKDGGKWRESNLQGMPPHGWGGKTYMSYLTPDDIKSYIKQDYGRHNDVKFFNDEESANDYADSMSGHGHDDYDDDMNEGVMEGQEDLDAILRIIRK